MELIKRTMCPKCKGKLQRIISVMTDDNRCDHREKKCCNCGHVFNTVVNRRGKK